MSRREIEPVVGQLVLPNGQVVNERAVDKRVRDRARRALAMQTIVIENGPSGIEAFVRWQMTPAVLDEFVQYPVWVAGIRALHTAQDGAPLLFGLPVVLVEQPDGEPESWALYLAIAA